MSLFGHARSGFSATVGTAEYRGMLTGIGLFAVGAAVEHRRISRGAKGEQAQSLGEGSGWGGPKSGDTDAQEVSRGVQQG